MERASRPTCFIPPWAAAWRCCSALCVDQLAQHPPRLQLRGVRRNVDQTVERATAAVCLDGLQHLRVFEKRGLRALVKQPRHFGIAEREVARKAKHVMA